MAVVRLFRDINMAAVTSCENTTSFPASFLYSKLRKDSGNEVGESTP